MHGGKCPLTALSLKLRPTTGWSGFEILDQFDKERPVPSALSCGVSADIARWRLRLDVHMDTEEGESVGLYPQKKHTPVTAMAGVQRCFDSAINEVAPHWATSSELDS